eukprot:CAMPEP_0201681578 /NCGR_PEP_ID=MMETSP0494-20130426/51184_1 /ASSEMBLY_ACC=CAM_ASM_000839 /TAXON_ID=420259 /ORGANISM="Thalassiosira gravida, Strain GMp14c1" /LENGTH=1079 /DNA_ID=CAMNT_0048165329 /DNA_START=177 /DNA_END=3416 /DNA_ORIENTATION=+
MNAIPIPSIKNGLETTGNRNVVATLSRQSFNLPLRQAPVSRVITKESLHDENPQEANTTASVSTGSSSPPLNDDDQSFHSSLFDFSLFEPESKEERELLSLPLTSIELPLTPPPLESSNTVSASFDSCAATLLTPVTAVSVSSSTAHPPSSLLSTAAAIAAQQHPVAPSHQAIRAPPIVSVSAAPVPSVVSPKLKRRKAPVKKKAPNTKKATQKLHQQQQRQQLRAAKAATPSPTLTSTIIPASALPHTLLTHRLIMDQQPSQHQQRPTAPILSPSMVAAAPALVPRPAPGPSSVTGIHHRHPQGHPQATAGGQPMPQKKYATAPSSAAMIQGYAQQAAAVAAAHHASQSRQARPPATSAPPAAAAAAAAASSAAAVAANTVSTLNHSSGQVENTGRWTSEEHRLFLQGLEQHGKGWKKIATLIKSRTVVQIRTHAQKYFQKLAKARQNGEAVGGVGMGTVGGAALAGGIPPGNHGHVHIGTVDGGEMGIAIPMGPDGQPVVTMRTTAHPRNMSLGNDPSSSSSNQGGAGQAGARGGRGRKRSGSAPGGGTKRRAIGNVVRSAVREGRNVKRQSIADAKRNASAAAATAPQAGGAAALPAPVRRISAPVPAQANLIVRPSAQPKQLVLQTKAAKVEEEYQVPNPLPAVSSVLEPYVSTAAAALGMRPAPVASAPIAVPKQQQQQQQQAGGQPLSKNTSGNNSQQQRGRQQLVHTSTHGTLPMAALEDAVFRLLTPATGAPSPPLVQQQQMHQPYGTNTNGIVDPLAPASNKIPIAHTQYYPLAPASAPGTAYPQGIPTGMSPTGVADMSLLPSWVDAKNPPSWYNDGSDIDTLLEDADCLNWLSDTGDLEETYPPAMAEPAVVLSSSNSSGTASTHTIAGAPAFPVMTTMEPTPVVQDPTGGVVHPSAESLSFLVDPPEHTMMMEPTRNVAGATEQVAGVDRLPSFHTHSPHTPPSASPHQQMQDHQQSAVTAIPAVQMTLPYSSATEAVESIAPEHKLSGVGESHTDLMGFPELDMGDEQAFVSALLETSGQSTVNFPKLHSELHMSHGNMSNHGNQSGVALNQHCGVGSGVLAGDEN